MGRGRADERLKNLVSCIRDCVFIPVHRPELLWPNPSPKRVGLRKKLLQAGAVDVIFGREHNLSSALQSMQYGYLPKAALNLDAYIGNGYFSIFCRKCAFDIRSIIKIVQSYFEKLKKTKGSTNESGVVVYQFQEIQK